MDSDKCEICGTALPSADSGTHDAAACRDTLRAALTLTTTRISALETELTSANQKRDQLFSTTVSQSVYSTQLEIAQQLGYERGLKAMQNAMLEGVVAKPSNSAHALAFATTRLAEGASPTNPATTATTTTVPKPTAPGSTTSQKPPSSASPRPVALAPNPLGNGRPSRPPSPRGRPSGR